MPARVLIPLILATAPLHAVIVAGGNGTQNTTAPTDDFGFANVGRVFDPQDQIFVTGVYLGDGWVISAYHGVRDATATGFSFGPVLFGSDSYTVDAGSAVRLTTPGVGLSDLSLFRLTTLPSLPSLTIASNDATNGLAVSMMGNGFSREASETRWLVNTATNPDSWTETPTPGNAQGYKWAGPSALRWGTNNVTGSLQNVNDGFGITEVFHTTFNDTLNDAQASNGDSGGGVFWKEGGEWRLGGIMLFITLQNGQPGLTSVYGNETYAANLSTYQPEIASIVPEPGSVVLVLAGATLLLRRRSRR